MVFLFLWFYFIIHVVGDDVGSESDESDSESREHAGKHGTIGEHRVFAPRITLGPWVPEERW